MSEYFTKPKSLGKNVKVEMTATRLEPRPTQFVNEQRLAKFGQMVSLASLAKQFECSFMN